MSLAFRGDFFCFHVSENLLEPEFICIVCFAHSQYTDMDAAENQNFLPEHNLGKKKYETEYVRFFPPLNLKSSL